jgi:hypothetical protein
MKDRIIHQWRDWVLEYVEDGKYELIQKENQSVRTILAKNDMDAENQSQLIIKNMKEGKKSPELQNIVES